MGSTPINPAGSGTPPGGGGGDDQSSQNLTNLTTGLNAAKNETADLASTLRDLKDTLQKMPGVAEDVSKKMAKVGVEMKGIVALADDAQEAMKGMADYTKALNKTLSTNRNAKELRTALQGVVEASEAALKRGIFSGRGAEQIQHRMAQAQRMAEELATSVDGIVDDQKHQAVIRFFKDMQREGEKAADIFNRVNMGTFTKSVVTAKKAMIDAGLMKAGRLEKYAAYAPAAVKMKDAAAAKAAGNRADFQRRREEVQERLGGIKGLNLPRTTEGKIDWAHAAAQQRVYKEMGFGKRSAAALQGAQGAAPGEEGAFAKVLMAGGGGTGGSMLRGLTESGVLEGGAGMISELVGKLALPLAILEGIKDIWDKNAQMNKDVEAALGGGGIFTGATGGMQSMDIARMNLTPQNLETMFYNRLGLNFDRNLKMAGAIVKSGYNVEDLTQMGGPGLGMTGDEFAPGRFGQIQQTAAVQGRILGLGDEQSVETIMKLLMQYRQSMEGAQDFFVNVEKDTRAAGISATKYISILEEITDHFGKFNKSIDEVAGTMRMLSATGRETAQDLQDNMKLLYGQGRGEDVNKGVYLLQQMQQTGGATVMQQRLQSSFARQAQTVTTSLQDLGMKIDPQDVQDMLASPSGQIVLKNMMTDFIGKNPKLAKRDITAASAAINAATSTGRGVDIVRRLASGGSAMDAYAQLDASGLLQNPQVMLSMTQGFMEQVRRTGGKGMDAKSLFFQGGAGTDMLTQQLTEYFLGDKQAAMKFQQMLQDTAEQRLQVAEQNPENSALAVKQIMNAIPELRGDMKQGESTTDALTRWSRDKRYGGKITYLLSGLDGGMNDLFDTNKGLAEAMSRGDIAKQKDQDLGTARQIGGATQTIEDVVKNIIPTLFNKVIGILEEIRGFFAHSRFFGGVNADEEKQAQAFMDQKDNTDLIANATQMTSKKLSALESLRTKTDNADDRQALEKQITDTQATLDKLTKKFGPNTGLGTQAASDLIGTAEDTLTGLNQPITDLMKGIGVDAATSTAVGGQYGYTLTDDQFDKVKDKIASFEAAGLAKDTPGTDSSGRPTHIIQTTNNFNSVDFQHVDAGRQSMVQSNESPSETAARARWGNATAGVK